MREERKWKGRVEGKKMWGKKKEWEKVKEGRVGMDCGRKEG